MSRNHLQISILILVIIFCDALHDLVPFVQFKNLKNTHAGVLLLVKLQASKSNTPPWVFFTFFKLYKWYQIAQRTTLMIIKNNKPFIEIRNHGTQHAILKMIET